MHTLIILSCVLEVNAKGITVWSAMFICTIYAHLPDSLNSPSDSYIFLPILWLTKKMSTCLIFTFRPGTGQFPKTLHWIGCGAVRWRTVAVAGESLPCPMLCSRIGLAHVNLILLPDPPRGEVRDSPTTATERWISNAMENVPCLFWRFATNHILGLFYAECSLCCSTLMQQHSSQASPFLFLQGIRACTRYMNM